MEHDRKTIPRHTGGVCTEQPDPKERFARLRLIRSRRVGLTTFYRLLAEYGSARAALAALPGIAQKSGNRDYSPCPEKVIHAELKAGKNCGATLVIWGDEFYSATLGQIPDPPVALWTRGDLALLARPAVALVGARNASSLGLRMARGLARGLGEAGICVVSGLARGVDASAHEAALETGTIGVLAGGIDVFYPPENASLAQQMARSGLLISELPPGTKPLARHFPRRNRIISGLSQVVVVVEAALKSGSMITARNALDQGREVMAVPGHPIDTRAGGCNALIRDGAMLVRNSNDILTMVRVPAPEATEATNALPENQSPPPAGNSPPADTPDRSQNIRRHPPRRPLAETAALHNKILRSLSQTPVPQDQLMRDLNVTLPDLDLLLTRLELEGRVERSTGGMLSITPSL